MRSYFTETTQDDAPENRAGEIEWRLSCYESGCADVESFESAFFPVAGKRVLDAACAWGGHAMAWAARGATVVGTDLFDYRYGKLCRFNVAQRLSLTLAQADCEALPFRDGSFDVILGLELVEHIFHHDAFAREVARLLRPEGIAIVSTPARLRAFINGEPHFGIRGIAALPLPWQRWVATRVFAREYPFPITRQYVTAAGVARPFVRQGLRASVVLRGRLGHRLRSRPFAYRFAAQFLWTLVVLQKGA